jgi:xanthine/CO dehydrogenase XdhC/CoxF family maturation factor
VNRFYENLAAAAAANRPLALAIIAGTKGFSPQRAGAKNHERALSAHDEILLFTNANHC